MSTHEIVFVTFPRMYSYFWMWRMSINAAKWIFLTFCFCVPSLRPPSISFPLSPFHLESTLLGVKNLLFILLGSPRHTSLRDRSPESSEPHVTLDSRSSLIRTIRISYFFLPRFTLESISCSDFFVSQMRCAARRDNMCLLSP